MQHTDLVFKSGKGEKKYLKTSKNLQFACKLVRANFAITGLICIMTDA